MPFQVTSASSNKKTVSKSEPPKPKPAEVVVESSDDNSSSKITHQNVDDTSSVSLSNELDDFLSDGEKGYDNYLKRRLIRFFKKYSPSDIPKVDKALAKHAGTEDELFKFLVKKYGPEPSVGDNIDDDDDDDNDDPKKWGGNGIVCSEDPTSSASIQKLHDLFNIMNTTSLTSAPQKNVICSPFNIATCISMLSDGAAGTTREELINTFNFTGPSITDGKQSSLSIQDEVLKAFKSIMDHQPPAAPSSTSTSKKSKNKIVDSGSFHLDDDDDNDNGMYDDHESSDSLSCNKSGESAQIGKWVKSAQAIFATKAIQQSYISKLKRDYHALAKQIDPSQTEAAVKEVNDFVSKATSGKIPQLLSSGDITQETVLVLVAALYFKANFQSPFYKEATCDRDFYVSATEQKQVFTMKDKLEDVYYYVDKSEGVVTVGLPYEKGELALVLEMQICKEGEKFAPLPEKSSASRVLECLEPLHRRRVVEVYLPKFKTESTFSNLKETFIQHCGIKEMFAPSKNDFHLICGGNGSDAGSAVRVTKIVHKAMIEVDEKGTVAAAATAVMVAVTGYNPNPPKPPTVKFDHPFYFHIVDNVNNCILFSGSISDPSSS